MEEPERFPAKHRNMIRKALLDKFFQDKADLPLDRPTYRLNIDLSNKLGENEKHTFAIDISVEELNAAWDTAYRQILNLAKENIRLVCEKEDVKKVFILLSGGSIANPKAKNEMMDACNTRGRLRSHGTTRNKITVKMMEDLMAYGWKWTQAEGAAHAMATTMDVEEFFARGAALAVQKSTFRGKWRFHTSGHAKLLFYKVGELNRIKSQEDC